MINTRFDLDTAILLSNLSIQSYRPPEKLDIQQYGLELIKFIENEKTHTQLYILGDDTRLFIVFRGTENLKDIINDIMIIKKKYPKVKRLFKKPKVHNGFLYSYLSVKDDIIQAVDLLLQRQNY